MSEEQLEDFIRSHREDFDNDRPSLKVWANIEKALPSPEKKRHRLRWLRSIAATVLLLVGVGLGLVLNPILEERKALQAFNKSQDYSEMKAYFDQEISTRFASLSSSVRADLATELTQIDQNIEDLKQELIRAPRSTREILMEAIIASYESKIEILERALNLDQPINQPSDEPKAL